MRFKVDMSFPIKRKIPQSSKQNTTSVFVWLKLPLKSKQKAMYSYCFLLSIDFLFLEKHVGIQFSFILSNIYWNPLDLYVLTIVKAGIPVRYYLVSFHSYLVNFAVSFPYLLRCIDCINFRKSKFWKFYVERTSSSQSTSWNKNRIHLAVSLCISFNLWGEEEKEKKTKFRRKQANTEKELLRVTFSSLPRNSISMVGQSSWYQRNRKNNQIKNIFSFYTAYFVLQ